MHMRSTADSGDCTSGCVSTCKCPSLPRPRLVAWPISCPCLDTVIQGMSASRCTAMSHTERSWRWTMQLPSCRRATVATTVPAALQTFSQGAMPPPVPSSTSSGASALPPAAPSSRALSNASSTASAGPWLLGEPVPPVSPQSPQSLGQAIALALVQVSNGGRPEAAMMSTVSCSFAHSLWGDGRINTARKGQTHGNVGMSKLRKSAEQRATRACGTT
mmetsp:Transcript_30361/g.97102  ORF Transcript_30361/g.97102 Transcript_30361/m.97102 type:complete len:218 (-) Transcript_30361:737-1390(-)